MRFDLSDEESMLQSAVAELARAHFGGASAPRTADADWRTGWEALAKMGLAGILVPERFGGAGGTLLDGCLVAEQLGRSDAWIPFVGSSIVAAAALLAADEPDEGALAALAEGTVFSLLVDETLGWPAGTGAVAFDWRDGARGVVADANGIAAVDELAIDTVLDSDPLHPDARVASPASGTTELSEPLRRARAAGWVGLAAYLTGVAIVALDEAVAYAKERQQFGVPIGSFQAVQHLCAEMYVDVETCRSIVYGAAWSVENAPSDLAERSAAAAKAWCGRRATAVCETSIQVFGGIGVTWEHPAHLRLRTAHHFTDALGRPDELERDLGRQALGRKA